MRRCWAWAMVVAVAVALAAGCGRPTLPGQQFREERAITSTETPTESPLPEKPYLEWGPAEAKVRVVAFFPIDDAHQKLTDLLREAAEQHPGKVYAKHVDYRTPEGSEMRRRTEMELSGVLINGKSSMRIEAQPYPYDVDFMQDMGRFWTEGDLKAAVEQEVARAYGGGGAGK